MDIATFRLSAEQFDQLASGYGDAQTVALLRAGQVSRRRLLLRTVREAAPASAPALALLVEAERHAPAAALDALAHPLLAAWAMSFLRRWHAGMPTDLGYLSAFAAAAAARAGIVFDVQVPVLKGTVALPMLGTASGLHGDETTVRGDGTVMTVGHVEVPAPYTTPCTGWRPRPVAGPLAIEDADPYRGCFHHPPAAPLDPARLAGFVDLLRLAWDRIEADYPAHAEAMRGTLVAVVPLLSPGPDRTVSAATPDAFGAVGMSIPPDVATAAELLIHELQHMKLGGLLDIVQLTTVAGQALYHAPWRADPRPVGALLQGAYAHTGVTDFWRVHRRRSAGQRARRAQLEFAYWLAQTRQAVATLAASTELTAAGRRFVTRLGATLDGWRSEPVPADAATAADRMVVAAAVGWRLRNYIPAPGLVTTLTRRWLAGAACPPVPMPILNEQPTRPAQPFDDSWIGLTLAMLDEMSDPASQALLARPDLVRAVCKRVDADPAHVASWLAPGLGPSCHGDGGSMSQLSRTPPRTAIVLE